MANIIKGYRNMVGMKQSEMAEIIGVSRQAYWNKETGRTPFSDKEKELFREEIKKVIPEIKIDDIFFNHKVGK